MSEPALSPTCPSCGSLSIRRSRSTMPDRALSAFGWRPVKCRQCGCRFRTRCLQSRAPERQKKTPESGGRSESARRRRAARRREIQVYAYALMAFLMMLYVITRERGLSE